MTLKSLKQLKDIIEIKRRRKDVTFIQGARYKGGVILISDRKTVRGSDTLKEDKLFSISIGKEKVIAGFSGATSLIDRFNRVLNLTLKEKKPRNLDEFLDILGDVVEKINYIKRSKLGESSLLEGLLCVRNNETGKIELHHLNVIGETEKVNWRGIGEGEPLGRIFLKAFFHNFKEYTWKEIAMLGCIIIKVIEEFELSSSVGYTPQIWIIPDNNKDRQLKENSKELIKMLEDAFMRTNELEGYLMFH